MIKSDKMKRITLFSGHYGSGKTNIAVCYALDLAKSGKKVGIYDLDIVNPYFRAKDSFTELEAAGVGVVASPFANSNVDTPALPSEMYAITEDKSAFAVVDVGGDDRGALALGRIKPEILSEDNFDMLFVCNFRRPLTPDASSAYEVMKEIEEACGMPFTGIVNNTNLGDQTTRELIDSSSEQIKELCRLSRLPLRFTCARADLAREDEFPLTLQKKPVDF